MPIQKEFNQLHSVFKEFDVSIAYVFGSVAAEKAGPLSDLDIAVLFYNTVSADEHFERCLHMSASIRQIVGVRKVDVVALNSEHNPLLRFNAVFKGRAIFVDDVQVRIRLERRVRQQYEDTRALRERQFAVIKSKLEKKTPRSMLPGSEYLQKILSK